VTNENRYIILFKNYILCDFFAFYKLSWGVTGIKIATIACCFPPVVYDKADAAF
jgi:hypothetical protein